MLGLHGCGSGGEDTYLPAPKATVAIYGDSITASTGIKTSFAKELEIALNVKAIDMSVDGGIVANFLPPLKTADTVIIRFGGADALKYGNTLLTSSSFEKNLSTLVESVPTSVVLTSTITLAPYDEIKGIGWSYSKYLENVQALADANTAIKKVAVKYNVPYVNLLEVPFRGKLDLHDYVHPNQEYSSKLTSHIIATLATVEH